MSDTTPPAAGTWQLLALAFRVDPAMRYGTLAVLAFTACYPLALVTGYEIIDWYQGLALGLAVAVWALRHGLRELDDPAERRFWSLYAFAFLAWLAAALFRLFFPEAYASFPGLLFEDFCYLVYYFLFLLAIESHPHRVFSPAHAAAWRARRRLELEATAIFAVGLACYYILSPFYATIGEYSTYFPSQCLYVTMDLLILIRVTYAYRLARGKRWRVLYGFVLTTAVCLASYDVFDALAYYPGDRFFYSWDEVPKMLYTLWFLYLLPLIWGARLRLFLPPKEALETTEESLIRERLGFAFSNTILLYATCLPLLHLFYQFFEVLDPAANRPRTLIVLLYLFAFGQLLHRQHKYEQTRSMLLEVERQKSGERERRVTELEARSAETERFAYTVSHDLKSPITTIVGFLGLLEDDIAAVKNARAEKSIHRIRSAATNMVRLLDDVLEVSRCGRIVGEPRKVSLGELVHEALLLLAGPIAEKGVEVEVSSDLPVVFGDRTRLLQVLQNLIENAVKYMGSQAAPRIEISVREDGGETVCYVRDNGIGIEPEHHDDVFGLFDQLDTGAGGSGIGLATVRRIIEVHGGRIWVESEGPGRGSTMCFTLPWVS